MTTFLLILVAFCYKIDRHYVKIANYYEHFENLHFASVKRVLVYFLHREYELAL